MLSILMELQENDTSTHAPQRSVSRPHKRLATSIQPPREYFPVMRITPSLNAIAAPKFTICHHPWAFSKTPGPLRCYVDVQYTPLPLIKPANPFLGDASIFFGDWFSLPAGPLDVDNGGVRAGRGGGGGATAFCVMLPMKLM